MTALLRTGIFTAVLLLLACSDSEPQQDENVLRHQIFALGTLVEITIAEPPENIDQVLRAAEVVLHEMDQRWHAWDEGDLARLNRQLAETGSAELDADMLAGIQRALKLAKLTDNRFNPAIGELVRLWGFHRAERNELPPPASADLATLTEPLLDPASLMVDAENTRIETSDPRIWLDMGGFAKGLAVDAAMQALRAHGIDNAIVNAGGDLQTMGQRIDRNWRVGIRHPTGPGLLAVLDIDTASSVFTSGNYERRFEWHGEMYHHILDPVTGMPARGFAAVTVVHPDAALADAAATALFVAGPDHWLETAHALGLEQVMAVTPDGRILATAALRERLDIDADKSVEIVSYSTGTPATSSHE
jgi:thiamine biosynthesis lipoprotein